MFSVLASSIQAKIFVQNVIKQTTSGANLFWIVQKYLYPINTKFHTFSLSEERNLKVVIKILLTDVMDTELSKELNNQDFEVLHVELIANIKIFPKQFSYINK